MGCRRSGGRVVEGARLESEYTAKPYRGFESLPLRQLPRAESRRLSLPAAAKRLEQIDLGIRDASVSFGQRGFGLGGGPFGVQQLERTDVAFALTGASDGRGLLRLVSRGAQGGAPIERLLVARKRCLGFFQRLQYGAVEGRQRGLGVGLRFGDAG